MPVLVMNLYEFTLLGFEPKQGFAPDVPTIDSLVWETDEARRNTLLKRGAKTNRFDLITCNWDLIEEKDSISLAVVALKWNRRDSFQDTEYFDETLTPVSNEEFLARGWKFLGIDIVELGGLFSIHGIDGMAASLSIPSDQLLQCSINEANFVVAAANELVPEHSPFVPVFIYSFSAAYGVRS